MKDTIANKIASFKATIDVAVDPQNNSLWQDQPPQAFADGIGVVNTAVVQLGSAAAAQSENITGSTAALHDLRQQCETAVYPLARATFQCLTSLGRTDDAAKVDFSVTDLHNARAVALSGMCETVLNLAEPVLQPDGTQPAPGIRYGIDSAKVSSVDAVWQKYSTAVGAPLGARAKRKALTDALPGQCAAVEAQFAALDDLVVQFRGTDAGNKFVDAWFNARHVVDAGHRFNKPTPAPATTPAK